VQPAQGAPQPSSAPPLTDPILVQIEKGVEAKVPKQLASIYKSLVVGGMAIMFSPQTHGLMQKRLSSGPDMTANVSSAIADLIVGIINTIGKRMSKQQQQLLIPASVLASVTLMCQMLNYAEKTSGQPVTAQEASGCAQATTQAVLQKFGIGPQQVQQVVQQGKAKQGAAAPAAGPIAPQPQGAQ
jgi:hypothetical protein